MVLDKVLSDREFSELREFLGRVPGGPIQNEEALDGFFAALVCCPDAIAADEIMPVVLNVGPQDNITHFANETEAKHFAVLLGELLDDVSHQITDMEDYAPFVLVDQNGKFQANDWARGFLCGTELRHDIWVDLFKNEKERDYMLPIWALAYEHDEKPEMRPFTEPVSDQLREDLYLAAAASVMEIYKYFRKKRFRFPKTTRAISRSGRKTGRNAPCACGSGRKFKQCCGR